VSTQRNLATATDVQRAIKVNVVTLGNNLHHWRLTNRGPHVGQRCLMVEAHLIDGQDSEMTVILQQVSYFFSSCSSKSAISC